MLLWSYSIIPMLLPSILMLRPAGNIRHKYVARPEKRLSTPGLIYPLTNSRIHLLGAQIPEVIYLGREICSEYLPFRTQVLYRPRQNDRQSMMFGTSLYGYHTITYPHSGDSANERYHIRGEHVSSCVTLWVASSCVTA
ncbi:hypothetical protein TNCV_103561 [Trichonephila clavipes]|nr:hypothetical protein TNCV_103561 [Trichonephila clavipes]